MGFLLCWLGFVECVCIWVVYSIFRNCLHFIFGTGNDRVISSLRFKSRGFNDRRRDIYIILYKIFHFNFRKYHLIFNGLNVDEHTPVLTDQ